MAEGSGRSYRLEVVSPERILLDTKVRSLSLMTEDGSVGVLAGHAPLVASLVPCAMTFEEEAGDRKQLAVGEGFLEVASDGVRVLVDSAERPDEIDVERAREAMRRAEELLMHRLRKDIDVPRAEAALARARARLKVAGAI